jgi:hypothetical protein
MILASLKAQRENRNRLAAPEFSETGSVMLSSAIDDLGGHDGAALQSQFSESRGNHTLSSAPDASPRVAPKWASSASDSPDAMNG